MVCSSFLSPWSWAPFLGPPLFFDNGSFQQPGASLPSVAMKGLTFWDTDHSAGRPVAINCAEGVGLGVGRGEFGAIGSELGLVELRILGAALDWDGDGGGDVV